MENFITRRDFLKASGFVLAAGGLTDRLIAADLSSSPDLVAVEGLNYYDSTTKAVEALEASGSSSRTAHGSGSW